MESPKSQKKLIWELNLKKIIAKKGIWISQGPMNLIEV